MKSFFDQEQPMEFPPPLPPTSGPGRTPKISRETLFGLGQQAPATAPGKVQRLRGVVGSGVERHSLVLVGPQGQLLAQLVGGPTTTLVEGQQVVVTGVFLPDRLTTAQQGVPFRVLTAEPHLPPS